MVRSFLKLYSLALGAETEHVLTMRTQLSEERYPTPEKQQQFFDSVVARLATVPGIAAASTASALPLNGGNSRAIEIEGRPTPEPAKGPTASMVSVGTGYFDVFRIPVQRGRAFRIQDGTPGQETVIVNERFAARFFGAGEPLGQRIRPVTDPKLSDPNPWLTIVGIVPTVRQRGPRNLEDDAVLYRPDRQQPLRSAVIVVRAEGNPALVTGAVREAVQQVDVDQPVYNIKTMNQVLADNRWPYRVFGSMFAIFAVVALVLSSVGIYAVTAYSVSQRTAEIGVRMALGAQPGQVSWLILKGGLIQLALGLSLGLLGGWGVTFVLASIVAQIPATDPVTFVFVTVLLSLVTIVACLIPARRAMRLDPLKALNRG
jgi:predicted permease